jgi:hypothetical protein
MCMVYPILRKSPLLRKSPHVRIWTPMTCYWKCSPSLCQTRRSTSGERRRYHNRDQYMKLLTRMMIFPTSPCVNCISTYLKQKSFLPIQKLIYIMVYANNILPGFLLPQSLQLSVKKWKVVMTTAVKPLRKRS